MWLRHAVAASASTILVAGLASAQTTSARPSKQPSTAPASLAGCVAVGANNSKTFTLADASRQETYVLKGLDVREFVGKRVEITGMQPKGLRVVGGLYPTPNVAAQGGAIDPTKAAIAAQSGPSAQTPKPPVEFNVTSVRLVSGTCSDAPPQ